MIRFEEALAIVLGSARTLGSERVVLGESLNRILAEDVVSDMKMPPFNKSAVDGYACRKQDLSEDLKVLEVIPAGKMPTRIVGPGTCSKIMTGAPVPEGADTILMVEDVEELPDSRIRYMKETVKDNICYVGEDIQDGETVLSKSTRVQPQHIAVMATAGCSSPRVYKQARVGVISTGDELVEPDVKPGLSQIRNSNAYQLVAQIRKIGARADYIGIALDTEESTRNMIRTALDRNDVVLLTGGVSMGDFDHVPKILDELGVELRFKSIAVQPGRPTVFGTRDKGYIFGLPGNPVSSFVQFELLVKPLIYKMMGSLFKPLVLPLKMHTEYSRKRSGRLSWMPVRITEGGEVEPINYHGSAHINALTLADGMISIPIGKMKLEKGEEVHVRFI